MEELLDLVEDAVEQAVVDLLFGAGDLEDLLAEVPLSLPFILGKPFLDDRRLLAPDEEYSCAYYKGVSITCTAAASPA